ncbi:hypothetical protein ACA910_000887 [Epithemia clementina (nom. ined.)]
MVQLWSTSSSSVSTNSASSSATSSSIRGDGDTIDPKTTVIDIYPWESNLDALRQQYKHVKTIYYIRHAEGSHNVNMEYRDMINFDARLTKRGQSQCRELADRIRCATKETDPALVQLRESVQLVVTSPLTRCLQTALLSLEPVLKNRSSSSSSSLPPPLVLAHDGIRETVNYNCDRRRTTSELAQEFGTQIDFSFVPDEHDTIWEYYESFLGSDTEYTKHRESAQAYTVAQRARGFFTNFLSTRPEQHVCLCSHRAFSRVLWNYGLGYATNVPQFLDQRTDKVNVPIVRYMGDDDFASRLSADYDNCELRAMVVAF